jgi:hypothetical protein
MPAHCHDDRLPLFAHDPVKPENTRSRIPEPSPPPWQGARTPPAAFYRTLFAPYRHMGRSAILAHLLLRVVEAPPVRPAADWE